MKISVKKTAAALLALAMTASCASCTFFSTQSEETAPSAVEQVNEKNPELTATAKETETAEPEQTTILQTEAPQTEAAVTEAAFTEAPTEETAAPEAQAEDAGQTTYYENSDYSEADEAQQQTAGAFAKGTCYSTESSKIYTQLDWTLTRRSDGKVDLQLDLSLWAYEIYAQEKPEEQGRFTIGETTVNFATPALSYDGSAGRKQMALTSTVVTLEGNEEYLPIAAEWDILAYYGGQDIETLTCGVLLDLLDIPEENLINQ